MYTSQVKWIVLTYTVQLLQLPAKFDGNLRSIFKVIAKTFIMVYFMVDMVYKADLCILCDMLHFNIINVIFVKDGNFFLCIRSVAAFAKISKCPSP